MAIIEVEFIDQKERTPGFIDTDHVSAASRDFIKSGSDIYLTGYGDGSLKIKDPEGAIYKRIFDAKAGYNEPVKSRLG